LDGFLKTYAHPSVDMQTPVEAAVIIPTILRPCLSDAVRSVFAQAFPGRIHILLGIDVPAGDPAILDEICANRPENCIVQVYYPGYSTSRRHGGLSPAGDGGVLRTVLTYLANSPFVAYLDDDNAWHPEHLARLRTAVEDSDWAYALRWFVHPETGVPLAIDIWESVGPGRGVFAEKFGGFVDPNCLMINKFRCPKVIPLWRRPVVADPRAQSADRTVFDVLQKHYRGVCTNAATVYYRLDFKDANHEDRMGWMGLDSDGVRKKEDVLF
jgi:hypothetical protein